MTATYYIGDALEVMAKLPEKSVDLVLTSPPFLALRSYLPADHPDKALEGGSQLTPGAYIDWLIDVVEACDRVLAPHGSLCFELGDTYAGSGGGGGEYDIQRTITQDGQYRTKGLRQSSRHGLGWPLVKSLALIPELFRFSLVYGQNPLTGRQTERWRLRNVVRWVRPNPPVGALGDKFRPATSELMVFCKSVKRFFDLDAVREPTDAYTRRSSVLVPGGEGGDFRANGGIGRRAEMSNNPAGAPPLDWWNIPLSEGEEPTKYGPKQRPTITPASGEPKARQAAKEQRQVRSERREPGDTEGIIWTNAAMAERTYHKNGGAPPLDWWNIPPGGYSGAHYAVWPPELLIKPIKAMCPEKVCRVCGDPPRRITESQVLDRLGRERPTGNGWNEPDRRRAEQGHTSLAVTTLGFTDCGHSVGHCSFDYPCDDHWRSGLVLDPFAGSGTTLLVATGHGRDAIGIDLDERNWDLSLERVGPFMLERGKL